MDTLILTLQLFTSLPIKKAVEVSDERLIRGVALWPAAGIVIGLFQALVFCLADGIFPLQIAAVLALMAELWMTRGFHLDGLCDTAMPYFLQEAGSGCWEIMKDSHIGTFGVVAAVMDLALKYLLVTASEVPVYMLLAAPVAGKMVQGICMYRVNYPREKGLGKSYIGRVPASITVISVAFGALWAGGCLISADFTFPEAVGHSGFVRRTGLAVQETYGEGYRRNDRRYFRGGIGNNRDLFHAAYGGSGRSWVRWQFILYVMEKQSVM